MVNEKHVQQLMTLGLSRYSASAYLALLWHDKTASAAEVSDRANVPRQRVYDVLEGLRNQGLVVTKDGRPMKYMALHPGVALSSYLETRRRQHQTEINFLVAQVDTLVSELGPTSEEFSDPNNRHAKGREPLGGF